ncbi:MAG: CRISPR-associated endonuclease Cas2 [Chitinispirillia bacterium]|nr:CRISPR-associated endonuclease Cas2 [Chitinispirillia bacterium]MCL2268112.1 CRISPR-associated endonuclease Cas2 [Chitinispirillia bacterium]
MPLKRISQYRVMWIMVLFDLPTETKADRKRASQFRTDLLQDGFEMLQFSVYWRHCTSKENAETHIKRVKEALPKYGKVGILCITDKQFGNMQLFFNANAEKNKKIPEQLELF